MALNLQSISAGQAAEVLRAGWAAQRDGKLLASYMLHGRPGVGKTDIVRQLAEDIGARLFDLRLTTIEPQDLRGLPYFDHTAKKTVWYRPEDLPEDPDRPSVLFLDELTAAAPALQPAVYGLLQERRVGPHVLPPSVFVVAAGNTVEDGAIAYEMGTALSDRLIHLHVAASASDWLENYAVPHGLHPAVISFIRTRADLLETGEQALQRGDMIAATPRSWDRVAQVMAAGPARRVRDAMVAGIVGESIAAEFAVVADDIAATVHVEDMIAAEPGHRAALYPASMHGLNALIFSLVGVLDASRLRACVEIMAGIRTLAQDRPDGPFRSMPLAELCTYGFELLIGRALADGLGPALAQVPAYKTYAAEREAAGLA